MRRKILCLTDRLDTHGVMTNGVRVAKACHALGYNVMVMEHKRLDADKIHEADMILAAGTLVYAKNRHQATVINKHRKPGSLFVLWYFDACCPQWKPGHGKYAGICQMAPIVDVLATTDHSYPWEKHAHQYVHLMQGVDAGDFAGEVMPHDTRNCDVIFTGSRGGGHYERRSNLDALKEQCSLVVYGPDSNMFGAVYGRAFFQAHQNARVAYVPKPPKVIPGPYWSNRVYMAAATGTPCVVGYTPGIDAHYEHEREVLYFDTKREMLGHVRALVRDVTMRQRMGTAARERTLAEHTYTNRVRTLIERIRDNGHSGW